MNYSYTTTTLGGLAQEFEKMFGQPSKATYPPYNVIKDKETEDLHIEFAVAGFEKDEVKITVDKGILTIAGEVKSDLVPGLEYVYKGIATRKFSRSFTIPEYYEVDSATIDKGILYIDLVKNVPEEKKPREIQIS